MELGHTADDAGAASPLERLFARIGEVSSLPDVALEIAALASDTDNGAADLLAAVRRDPALSMRLMRTVNSSYYALRARVTNLGQAINILGVEEVRNLALTAYVAPLFKQTTGYGVYSRYGLWQHMVAAGGWRGWWPASAARFRRERRIWPACCTTSATS